MASQQQPFEFDAADQARYRDAFDSAIPAAVPDRDEANLLLLTWTMSPVGPLLVGVSDGALQLLEFSSLEQLGAQIERLRKQPLPLARGTNATTQQVCEQLAEYFAGTRRQFALSLRYHGTPFQERVWSALLKIPYGETRSYGFIAKEVGDATAMRAVGAANGLNPIAIVIPCHRVVNASGALGGYGGGSWRKRLLLDLEVGQQRLVF